MNHTPTPWKVGRHNSGYISDSNYSEILRDVTYVEGAGTTTYILGKVTYPASGPDTVGSLERAANAEFIVKACNSHHELLAAANAALSHLGKDFPSKDVNENVYLNLKAAIEKAEYGV